MKYSMKRAATDRSACAPAGLDRISIVGYGNSLRRDDGAGPILAQKVADYLMGLGVHCRVITAPQLLPEMAAELADPGNKAVIMVDVATGPGSEGFAIRRVDVDAYSPSTGHQLAPATLLLYTALLYGRTLPGWLVTIAGYDFDHGEGFSPQVATRLANAEPIAAALYRSLCEEGICTS